MPKLADTALASGAAPMFSVVIWNADHTRRKMWGNYANEERANSEIRALRRNGLDAELITVGKT